MQACTDAGNSPVNTETLDHTEQFIATSGSSAKSDSIVQGTVLEEDQTESHPSNQSWSDLIDAAAILAQQDEVDSEEEPQAESEEPVEEVVAMDSIVPDAEEVPVIEKEETVMLEEQEVQMMEEVETMVDEHGQLVLGDVGAEEMVVDMDVQVVEVEANDEDAQDDAGVKVETIDNDLDVMSEERAVDSYSDESDGDKRPYDDDAKRKAGAMNRGSSGRKKKMFAERRSFGNKLFFCPYCNFSCYNLDVIHAHQKEHPMEGEFKCSSCEYASDYQVGLDIHKVIHEGEPPYRCPQCSYKCNLEYQLNKHVNSHTGEKQFKCKLCNYSTDFTTNFRRHVERHASKRGQQCSMCSYSCTHNYQLQKHIESAHGDDPSAVPRLDTKPPKRQVNIPSESEGKSVDEVPEVRVPKAGVKHAPSYGSDGSSDSDGSSSQEEVIGFFKCKQCDYTTKYNTNMKRHQLIHKPGDTLEVFKCDHCSYITNYQSNLVRHYKLIHHQARSIHKSTDARLAPRRRVTDLSNTAGRNIMKCDYCDYQTQWSTNLRRHYMTHSVKQCPYCDVTFETKKQLTLHVKTHGGGTSAGSYSCKACGFRTSDKESWIEHKAEHHSGRRAGGGSDSAPAPIARTRERRNPAPKKNSSEFIDGSDLEIVDEEAVYSCSSCQFSCESERELAKHMKTHNRSQNNSLHCDQCDFSCTHESWLIAHMRTHAEGNTTLQCEYCSYVASVPHRLKAHMMTHTGEKPFKCNRCEFATTNSSNLYRHIRTKHDPADIDLVRRNKRTRDTDSDADESPQQPRHHGKFAKKQPAARQSDNGKGAVQLKIFRCSECDFSTVSKEDLDEHKEIHVMAGLIEDESEGSSVEESTDGSQRGASSSAPEQIPVTVAEITPAAPTPSNHITRPVPSQPPPPVETKPTPSVPSQAKPQEIEKFVCSKCRVACNGWELLGSHFAVAHPSFTVRKCQYCIYAHHLNCAVSKHKVSHFGGGRPYKCHLCQFATGIFSSLQRHARIKHRCQAKVKRFQPNEAPEVAVPSDDTLASAQDQKAQPVTFACKRCGFTTDNRNDWGKHLNMHAQEQLNSIATSDETPVVDALEVDTRVKAASAPGGEPPKLYQCMHCEYSSKRRDWFQAHIRLHGQTRQPDLHKCDVCEYSTPNPYNMIKHKRIHTGEKPFKCQYCTYMSADSGNLNKHVKSHHSGKGRISSKKKAGKEVKVPRAVKKVVAPRHMPEGKKNFQCKECDYKCDQESWLIAHKRLHKRYGDMYKCALCAYECRSQANFAKHIRTHTGEKPYACIHCDYTAADKANLNKHIKSHHKEEENVEVELRFEVGVSADGAGYTSEDHDDLTGDNDAHVFVSNEQDESIEVKSHLHMSPDHHHIDGDAAFVEVKEEYKDHDSGDLVDKDLVLGEEMEIISSLHDDEISGERHVLLGDNSDDVITILQEQEIGNEEEIVAMDE